ncbi:MAG: alkaline phosphatase family protein [Thermoplasmata archaeon]|nr:alkaline phosphatase family protein [Thermoplasmata archaeon]
MRAGNGAGLPTPRRHRRGFFVPVLAIFVVGIVILGVRSVPVLSPAGLSPQSVLSGPSAVWVRSHSGVAAVASTISAPGLRSVSGDTVLVLTAVRGSSDFGRVQDSAGDPFTRLGAVERTDGATHEWLSAWVARDAAGASSLVVNATGNLSVPSALLVDDLGGAGDRAALSLSPFVYGSGNAVSSTVAAAPKDLALTAVAVEGGVGITSSTGGTRLNVENLSNPFADTGADFDVYSAGGGPVTQNLTLSTAHPWIAVTVAVAAKSSTPLPHSVWNVVLIYMENHDAQDLQAHSAGYFRYLTSTFSEATAFYGICHPSAANYLAFVDANSLQCGSDQIRDGHYPNSTLPDRLESHGLTWGGYMESMPAPCGGMNHGEYVVRHDPFVYFRDVYNNSPRCSTHVVNSAAFNESIQLNHTLPANVSFYSPNLIDDCHDSGLSVCGTWLRGFLGPILNSTDPKFRVVLNHTVFLVTFDESDANVAAGAKGDGTGGILTSYDGAGYNGTWGGHLWFVGINPGGYLRTLPFSANSSAYNVLTTVEWLFHLGSTGGVDTGTRFSPMRGLFNFTSNGY